MAHTYIESSYDRAAGQVWLSATDLLDWMRQLDPDTPASYVVQEVSLMSLQVSTEQ